MGRNYERLDIVTFGKHLLDSGDLDPVYIALHKMELDEKQLHRWLIAYWCLYHVGSACWISEHEGADFWTMLMRAAENTEETPAGGRWPRGHERRHFRGQAAVKAVKALEDRYEDMPEVMVGHIMNGKTYVEIAARAQQHPLFGPWISFKICDMVDRVLGQHVDFSEAEIFMFKDPVQAALKLWRQHQKLPDNAKPKDQRAVIHSVVSHLRQKFSGYDAPPLADRSVDLQEIETILCKWKSHMNGHYPLNNDIDEINEGLTPWLQHSSTASMFMQCMPRRL